MQTKLFTFLAVLACGAVQTVSANDIEPGKEFQTVVYAPKPIVLDGDLSEWSGAPVISDPKSAVPKFSGTNANPNYVLFEEYNGGTWSGPDDQTSAVQIVFDTENVYLGIVVTDDYHENAFNSAWNGDSVQLMIASADRTTEFALYNYALGGTEAALGSVIIDHERGGAADPACNCNTDAVVKRDTVNKKTIYEIKLPKAAVGLTSLRTGPQLGLGMAINDGDAGPGQNGQKGWGGLGVHAIVHLKTPSETALMTLKKMNDIEPGKEYYTALRTTNVVNLDGNLTEFAGATVVADPKFAAIKFSGTNDNPNYILFEEYNGGTWTGPDDQTSAVQIVYDADNVYIGVVVTDDYHENALSSPWNGDSVQLMIANADRTTEFALYNYALGGVEGSLGSVIVEHERGGATDPACGCDTSATVTRDAVNKKTFYEIKLPAAAVGLTAPLTAGTKFGLGMAINDGDSGAGQAGQKGWGGLGAHAIVHLKTASETAEVTLGTSVSGGDLLFLSSINQTYNSFTFRATDKGASIVNPTSARLILDGVTNTLTASPKVVDATDFTFTPSSPFQPNSAHTYRIEIKDTLGSTVSVQGNFRTDNYSLDKLHSYYAQLRSGSALTPDKGGHTGQAGDTAVDFGTGAIVTAALVPDAAFLNAPASNNAITVSAWIKKYDNAANSSAFWVESASTTGNRGVQANVPTPDLTTGEELVNFDVGGNVAGDSQLSAAITTFPGFTDANWWTNWHHFVFKHTNDTKQIWIDGQLFVEGPAATPLPTDFTRIWLGAAGGSGGQAGAIGNMHGLIDDFAMFGSALTQAQIQQLFTGTLPSALPASAQALAYWDFNAAAAPSPTFTVTAQISAGQIQITWTEPGTVLQESTNLTSWADLTTATSPYRPTTTGRNAGYYRLKK